MGRGSMLSGAMLVGMTAMGGAAAGDVPWTGAAAAGSGIIEVSDVGPGGFTVDVFTNLPAARGSDGAVCASIALPPVGGDAVALGGRAEYAWLMGMPDADPPTVELLDVRSKPVGAPATCRTTSGVAGRTDRVVRTDRAVRTDRIVRDVSLQEATPLVLDKLAVGVPGAGAIPSQTEPVVAIDGIGTVRDQPVGRLVVRPIAARGDGSLVVRTHVRARVRYADPAGVARASGLDGPFVALSDRLLNNTYVPRRDAESGRNRSDRSSRSWTAGGGRAAARPVVAADQDDRRRSADLPALKIVVERDGPVAVSGSQLAEAGWDLARVDPCSLSLRSGGDPWAMQVDTGSDAIFDPEDRVLFEGRAMTGPYTRTNVYWLRADGEALRMGSRVVAAEDAEPDALSFVEHRHFEEDTRILWSMTAEAGHDRWMWGDAMAAPSRVTHTLGVGAVSAEPSPARLRLALHGYTDDRAVDPDHHVRLWWNGLAVHETRLDGLGPLLVDVDLPAGTVKSGDNELSIESLGDTGASVDILYLNWIDLAYRAAFVASGDRLDFSAPGVGRHRYVLRGFAHRQVSVWDVTTASRPVALSGVDLAPDGAGGYMATFTDAAATGTRYSAFASDGTNAQARVARDEPSALRSTTNGADYVLITHRSLVGAVAPLAERRSAQGLRVTIALVDDIYDEFSHGVFDPRAIRSFLRHAFDHWSPPAPAYVLLVGEANLDYRGGYGTGPPNLVPSMQVEHAGGAQLTLYTSDQWFAMLHDDDVLPSMLVGRISASTPEAVATVVGKTLRFEDAPAGGTWRRSAILVADDNGASEFEEACERLASVLPPDGRARRFYAAGYPLDRDLSADIRAAIDNGAFALSFFGHGNVALWSPWPGGGRIFENHDIRRLRNGDRMPMFTSGTCMNGWIDHPLKPVSMTEQWLIHPDGGGVVAWGASGFVHADAASILIEHLYRGWFDARAMPVGALTAAAGARATADDPSHAHAFAMYTLLGDPAVVVPGVGDHESGVRRPTRASADLPFAAR